MVAEMRATQADIDSRRHFTPEKTPISDTRALIGQWCAPAVVSQEQRSVQTADSLSLAAAGGFIEMG